jgi:hypothetical protein
LEGVKDIVPAAWNNRETILVAWCATVNLQTRQASSESKQNKASSRTLETPKLASMMLALPLLAVSHSWAFARTSATNP